MAETDEDEFWHLALQPQPEKETYADESDSDDDDFWGESSSTNHMIAYKIPWKPTTESSILLKLSPLPDRDGIWSPLGAQAWHASSLLVAYLLQNTILRDDSNTTNISLLTKHLQASLANETTNFFAALELGSGAVGLAGIALGLILEEHFSSQEDTTTSVILSDNEPNVLRNLQQNVTRTIDMFQDNETISLPTFKVEHLDWNDCSSSSISNESSLQLIVGSELVYTHETAEACANVVLSLLQQHRDVLIFILQVTDRDGWKNHFLPTLREKDYVVVREEPTDNFELHEMARRIIPPGGTLDRFAFGGCYIYHKSSRLAEQYESR